MVETASEGGTVTVIETVTDKKTAETEGQLTENQRIAKETGTESEADN